MSLNILIKKYPKTFIFISSLAALYLLLLIPADGNPSLKGGIKKPFIWNKDSLWNSLEMDFYRFQKEGCNKIKHHYDSLIISSQILLDSISGLQLNPSDEKFIKLEQNIFYSAPVIPVCTEFFPGYINFYSKLRNVVKGQSIHWDINSDDTKNTLYRLLYGNRTAIEEIMLQLPKEKVAPLILGVDEYSSTPSAEILGVDVHSGDILVSRGGAPTSALIARGNDYPGNFSHVAFVHIDDKTKLISIIESHIERGITVSSLKEYLDDKKLRIMVLRLRADLIKNDPMIPHLAAELSLKHAKSKHIPYDFEMNNKDSEKQFCSEVVSSAYKELGITLWKRTSTISSEGVRNWLGAFGVRYFETEEPSDLEYDPQLVVAAEWRDPETLYKDHMDNAVTDIMLEEAENGERLSYTWYLLPAARIMKLYSMVLNIFGSEGPVPEGMSPEAALKNVYYSDKHSRIKDKLAILADEFKVRNGYTPPYWKLITLARDAASDL